MGSGYLRATFARPADIRDAGADSRTEDDEIQGRRDDGRDDALQQRAQGSRHLELVDRTYRVEVHCPSFTRLTKISSSELCLVWRSLKDRKSTRLNSSH